MSLYADISADLLEVESDLGGQSFTWNGRAYPCIPSSLASDALIVFGGEQFQIGLKLIVRANEFTTADNDPPTVDGETPTADEGPPPSGARIIFRETTYKVADVRFTAPRATYELTCIDESK